MMILQKQQHRICALTS